MAGRCSGEVPETAFDITRVQRFDPPLPHAAQWVAALLFVVLLGATLGFLWIAHTLPLAQRLAAAGMTVAELWLVGTISTPRSATLATTQSIV